MQGGEALRRWGSNWGWTGDDKKGRLKRAFGNQVPCNYLGFQEGPFYDQNDFGPASPEAPTPSASQNHPSTLI